MNKLYEGMFVFDANYAGKDWPGLEQHVNDLVQRHEGQLVHSERWPDRKLAYEMKGCKKGTYYLTYFNAPTTAIQGLQRDCELSDRVLRAMFLYEDELAEDCAKLKAREEAKAVEAEAAAAAKAEAESLEAAKQSESEDGESEDGEAEAPAESPTVDNEEAVKNKDGTADTSTASADDDGEKEPKKVDE